MYVQDEYYRSASRANRHTDVLGFKEIGGVGQLIYHNFRFSDYELDYDQSGLLICPVCSKESPPDLDQGEILDGKEILTSLCDLAKEIDGTAGSSKCVELVIAWCKNQMHPYAVDYLYKELTDSNFDINGVEADMAARDGIFSFNTFMTDLEKLYNATRFYIALEAVCFGDDEPAYNLYQIGEHFEAFPFFERYKWRTNHPDVDVSAAGGDLLKEMEIEKQYEAEHDFESRDDGFFYTEPYDEYEDLRDRLMDCIPDFRLRLKADPKTNRVVFAVDVDSAFDIAWYTLARMMSEDPAPEDVGKDTKRPAGVIICCQNCGRFIIRHGYQNSYCDRPECYKARKAKNARDFRRREAIKRAQEAKADDGRSIPETRKS